MYALSLDNIFKDDLKSEKRKDFPVSHYNFIFRIYISGSFRVKNSSN